ncbi:MAG TPA: serine/threonine-protein kinase [Vicinamibacterales bacterium]
MTASRGSETLLVPAGRDERQSDTGVPAGAGGRAYLRKRGRSVADRATTALPPDLLNQAAGRLRILALLYAFTFFMAAFFPSLLFPAEREDLFARPLNWAPGVISIAVALAVAWAIRGARLGPRAVMVVALVFEVSGSYGIAAAEFLQALDLRGPWTGLSWVAVWTLLFNVVVPTQPRYAVLAALASMTSVPAMVLLSLSAFPPEIAPNGVTIFFTFFFPYLLVVIMAYVGARVVYTLGKEVSRARELGSYRLVQRLGAGGMGEVWKADHRLLARPAAIKLIRSPLADDPLGAVSDDTRRRFEREAQLIARLRSPHTVTLFDFGVADDGSFYYVMELLEGLDADRMIRRFGPMPAERVVSVLRQICHSLSEAESCGLVHRDIKPANIFLCRYGEDHDFVKVLDFGIAKPAHATSESQTALTMAHVIRGTPAFIAPEQALGGDVDGRADIYSTGCVAYWLLTGELVFTADTPMKLLLAHAHAVPDPPSRKTELPIPAELDALVMACLAKEREQRPKAARDLLERLDAVPFTETWTEERAREWWKTHLPA